MEGCYRDLRVAAGQELAPLVIIPKHFVTIIACTRAQPTIRGFSTCPIAANMYLSPDAPPGRNEIRYQISATNCAADAAMTSRYPEAPPNEKVA